MGKNAGISASIARWNRWLKEEFSGTMPSPSCQRAYPPPHQDLASMHFNIAVPDSTPKIIELHIRMVGQQGHRHR